MGCLKCFRAYCRRLGSCARIFRCIGCRSMIVANCHVLFLCLISIEERYFWPVGYTIGQCSCLISYSSQASSPFPVHSPPCLISTSPPASRLFSDKSYCKFAYNSSSKNWLSYYQSHHFKPSLHISFILWNNQFYSFDLNKIFYWWKSFGNSCLKGIGFILFDSRIFILIRRSFLRGSIGSPFTWRWSRTARGCRCWRLWSRTIFIL